MKGHLSVLITPGGDQVRTQMNGTPYSLLLLWQILSLEVAKKLQLSNKDLASVLAVVPSDWDELNWIQMGVP